MEAPRQIDQTLSRKLANISVIAAIMVVVLHARGVAAHGSSGWWVEHVARQVCKAAVPFFFLASGFFLVGHWGSTGWYRQAISRRMRTLVLPYLVWCALWCCYFIPVCCRHGGIEEFLSSLVWTFFGLDIFKPPFYSVMWYLRALFFFVLMSPVLIAIVRCFKWWAVGVLYVADLIFRIVPNSCEGLVFGFFRYVFSLEGAAYFALGLGLRLGMLNRPKLPKLPFLLWVMVVLISCNTILYWKGVLPWMSFQGFVIPVVIAALWAVVPDAAWPSWLTKASFPLYVIHPFALAILTAFVFRTTNNAACLLLKISVAIVVSMGAIVLLRRFTPHAASVMFGGRS